MDGLYLLFCLVFIVFGVYLLYLQIRMSNDIHTMRELFTSLFPDFSEIIFTKG